MARYKVIVREEVVSFYEKYFEAADVDEATHMAESESLAEDGWLELSDEQTSRCEIDMASLADGEEETVG